MSRNLASQSLRVLVIANAYPSDKALYRNGFVHRRVLAYQEAGIEVDVFYHHEPVKAASRYTFEGVHVTIGRSIDLETLARTGQYDAYLIHFAEPGRVEPLIAAAVEVPVIVWIHGFEAEAWHRRWFNFLEAPDQVAAALVKKQEYYEKQNAFLRDLVISSSLDTHFVNVSRWFQHMIVEPDIGAEFQESHVIHNLIDEQLFRYRAKSSDMRLRILSIRPYASRKYANDLTVEAILRLSKRPYFANLQFTLCGEGPLFGKLTAPLLGFENVTLRNQFLSQAEVVSLHAEHGVFLAPTRFDSQGVSMCEAVSSGLVAVATDVSAIPEFITDRETGLLVEPESAEDLADAIEEMYFDSKLFHRLSAAGSQAMHTQCGRAATVDREVELIVETVGR